MLKRLTKFESKANPVASPGHFARRLGVNLAAAIGLITLSLLIGMAGYQMLESMSPVDSYLNASMILAGMGPVGTMQTTAGKIFAGTYALYSGVVLIFSTGIILAPVVHRLLHEFHVDDDETTGPDADQRRRH
jgi:hypothetical protein